MMRRFRFTIASLMVLTIFAAVATTVWLRFNRSHVIFEVPSPAAPAALKRALAQTSGIRHTHELVQDWNGPTQSIRVHVDRQGKIRITGFAGEQQTGMSALQPSIDNIPRWGNAVSVLITSDTDGWEDLPEKRNVVRALSVAGVRIYALRAN